MITGFRHKGLELYYREANEAELPGSPLTRISLILTRLEASGRPEHMNVPGYGFHAFAGNLRGVYSVEVTDQVRLLFQFEAEDATEVDYIDHR